MSTLWARPDRRRSVMVMVQDPYPVQFSVDYPDRPLNRLTTFFRIFTVIPIAIVLGTVSGGTVGLVRGPVLHRGCGRPAGPRAAADDPLPAQVPQVVVRLEPGAAAVQQPGGGLRRADGRHLPVDRRAPVGAPGLSIPGRAGRAEQVLAPGEVAPRDPALHRPSLPAYRRSGRGHR